MADPILLKQVPLFAQLEAEELQQVAQACRARTYKRGEVIFHEEDPGSALYILRSGQVKIVQLGPDGEEQILHVQKAGDALGELALIDGKERSAKAETLTKVEALSLHRAEFLELVQNNPRVGLAVMCGLAEMVRRLSAQVADLTALDVSGRVAKKLLELADTHGKDTPEGRFIDLPLTQNDLAAMIGATRVAVNQSLSYFKKLGLVLVERDGITIRQAEKLKSRVY